MIKFGGRCIVQKSRLEFECDGHNPWVRTPRNVAFCYNVRKISAGCLVVADSMVFV